VSIDRAQVRHVARLARLALSPQEEELYAAQLGKVLEYIERLAKVDVTGIEPLSFAGDATETTLRSDEPQAGLKREEALAAAPRADGQVFLVPRILE